MLDLDAIPQIPTENKYKGRRRPIRVIVIHTGETQESKTAAEGMCSWAANPAAGGSFHIAVDTDSASRSVDDEDTAWGAPGVNADGLHLELAGRAGQASGDWFDTSSLKIMANGAQVVAALALRHSIPLRWLTDAELADGVSRGLCTHAQASRVFGGDHWDPGPGFPHDHFIELCRAAAGGQDIPEEDDMQPADLMSNEFAEWMRQVLFIQPPLPNSGVTRDAALRQLLITTKSLEARVDALTLSLAERSQDGGDMSEEDVQRILAAIHSVGESAKEQMAQSLGAALDGATVTLDTKAGAK